MPRLSERLTSSKQTIPHYYLRRDIRIDALLALRAEINQQLAGSNIKASINDFFIKACAPTLQEVPGCNAVWAGDRILKLVQSDVSVAVSVEGGLYSSVLGDTHVKSTSTLSREVKELAERAREHRLQTSECEGGTLTVSNLGTFGVESFDAVINPPQCAVLAVGADTRKMIFDEPSYDFVPATIVSVTLSVDHRVVDGLVGAGFLSSIARSIENPLSILG